MDKPKIYPYCKTGRNQLYIAVTGIAYPCCWIGNAPYDKEYLNFYDGDLSDFDLNKNELEQILQSPSFKKLEESWESESPFRVCRQFCGEPRDAQKHQGANKKVSLFSQNKDKE